MKRTLLTILTVFYLGVSSGATVHFHYCMGELVKWGLVQPDKSSCNRCVKPQEPCKKSCCKDDYKQAKADKSQKTVSTVYQFKQVPVSGSNITSGNLVLPVCSIEKQKTSLSNAPPLADDIPVFILNCTFII